jgi:hypothetical protein
LAGNRAHDFVNPTRISTVSREIEYRLAERILSMI